MARQKNDGRGRLGGRKAGTPNKVTGTLKDFISEIIDENREQIRKDLKVLKAKDRLFVIERFMQYTLPKQQSIKGELLIDKLTDEQVIDVADKLLNEMENDSKIR